MTKYKMPQKVLSAALILFLLLLTACGKKSSSPTVQDSPSAAGGSPMGAQGDQDSQTISNIQSDKDNDIDPTNEVRSLQVDLCRTKETLYLPDSYNRAAEQEFCYPTLNYEEAGKYPELAKAFKIKEEESAKISEETLSQLDLAYDDSIEFFGPDSDMYVYDSTTAQVLRSDSRLVCLEYFNDNFLGGAHGTYHYSGEAFDTESGKKLDFSDIIIDEDKFYDIVELKLKEEYTDFYEQEATMKIDEYREFLKQQNQSPAWAVDYQGVIIYFNVYELGSYAAGAQIIRVDFDEAPELFNPKYTEAPDNYIINLNSAYPPHLDTGKTGQKEPILVEEVPADEEGWSYNYIVKSGDRSVNIEDWAYQQDSYIAYINNAYYFYIFESLDNDYTIIRTVDLNKMSYSSDESFGGSLSSYDSEYPDDTTYRSGKTLTRYQYKTREFTDPSRFFLSLRFDLFGTHSGECICTISEDGGLPAMVDNLLYLVDENVIKSRESINCQIVDEDQNVLEDVILPTETYLHMVRTDGETFGDFQEVDRPTVDENKYDFSDTTYMILKEIAEFDKNKPIYRIHSEITPDYYHTVNSMDEMQAFDGIMYAG